MNWEKNVRRVEPYVPGEQPKYDYMVKLNTNECPYPPSPAVLEALKDFEAEELRLYPAPDAKELVDALAAYHKVKPQQVFVGVGSDDVIALGFLTFFNSDKPILFPDVTYSFYPVWAKLYGIPYRTAELDADFSIVPGDYICENGGIIFPNPNAPTGLAEKLSTVESIVANNTESVVMVDEAYVDFGAESALKLVDKYENLLVIRTYSKSRALAGLRVGYAIGNEKLIKYLNDVKFSVNSYTMNRLSLKLGVAAIKDEEYFRSTLEKMIATRERMKEELRKLDFVFPDSKSNFVFATHKNIPAEEIYKKLREQRIFVRYFKLPRIDNYLRISVGTDDETDRLMDGLNTIVKSYEKSC